MGLKEVVVRVADCAVEQGDTVLVTLGLGSCVAIMLHDPEVQAAAMAHVLLPSSSLARDTVNRAKFPETAVPLLIQRLARLGAYPRRLVGKLAEGASMFSQLVTPGTIQMGERNVLASRAALRAAQIPILRESVGGDSPRLTSASSTTASRIAPARLAGGVFFTRSMTACSVPPGTYCMYRSRSLRSGSCRWS